MSKPNKHGYNGHETQTQLSLGWIDYGFRQLDPVLGMWHSQDKLAEKYPGLSAYCYAGNDPVNCIDLMGLTKSYTVCGYGEDPLKDSQYGILSAGPIGGGSLGSSAIRMDMCMGNEGSRNGTDAQISAYCDAVSNTDAAFKGSFSQFVSLTTNPGSLGGKSFVPNYSYASVEVGGSSSFKRAMFRGWKEGKGSLPLYANLPTISRSEFDNWSTDHGYYTDREILKEANLKDNGIYGKRKYYRILETTMQMRDGTISPNAYGWVTPKPEEFITYILIDENSQGARSIIINPSLINTIDGIVDNPNNSNSVISIFYQDEGYSGEAYLIQSGLLKIYENRAAVKEPQPQLQTPFFGFPIHINYMTW